MKFEFVSGKEAGLVQCRYCHKICRIRNGNANYLCPRCRSKIHFRKPMSVSRTWALLIASVILYFPANILQMTLVTSLLSKEPDTILSGIIYFIKTGMWPIALIIFIASVIVPLIKIFIIAWLLITIRKKSLYKPVLRTKLYRITEMIGRWSMMDIFVVTILAGLVQLGTIASFEAGPAAIYFCSVVILTMTAAITFDPRLIWDEMG